MSNQWRGRKHRAELDEQQPEPVVQLQRRASVRPTRTTSSRQPTARDDDLDPPRQRPTTVC